MLVKEALDLSDERSRLSVAGEALGQCHVANVSGSDQRQGEQFYVIFAVSGEVTSQAVTQRFQGSGRRSLFSLAGRQISSTL
ncbi:hypothetical protein [Deinococcus sp. AJ005]|uniref:hypothetical protein n=1 Tax=Deinococcus sp. AJ005 TaxID=2652443 RepID=UPI00125CB7BD|nr:hypothetical protein [Deinococcus sp. AJ005]QFP76689.1 hypothetical protein DAAJ005_09635 [Deinococcus sp. AJ005]